MIPSGLNFIEFVEKIQLKLTENLPGFDAQKTMSPSIREDIMGNALPNAKTRQSAVLLLLYLANSQLCTLFIKRPIYEGPHSGQVSLPGGKFEEADLSVKQTALRETEEEIGIIAANINIVGNLTPLYIPVSNMMVNPFVGYTSSDPVFHPNLQEVDYVISVPLHELTDPQNKSVKVISSHDRPITAPFFNVSNEMIWGATAMILAEFIEIINKVELFES